jgi:membrane protein implicated in regulation of membrane protease activity
VKALAERIVLAVVALALFVLGFFFLAAALVAGGILATIVLLRVWWLQRRMRKAEEASYLTTEFRVVEREGQQDPRLPPAP